MKFRKKYKTFKKKNIKTFQILNTCELPTYVGIKKCWNTEIPRYSMDPTRTTNRTYISRAPKYWAT